MGRLKGSIQKSKPVKGRKKHADYSEESKVKKRTRNMLSKRRIAAVNRELVIQNKNNNDQDIVITNHYYKCVGDILSKPVQGWICMKKNQHPIEKLQFNLIDSTVIMILFL
jgi:hypothetical protein